MDFDRAVEVFLLDIRCVRMGQLGGELVLRHLVHRRPALPGHPDRVDLPCLRGGWGGQWRGGGDSLLLLLHDENEDEEEGQENQGDGEEDGGDETDPAREREGGGEERSGLRDCQGDVGLLGEEES